MSRALRLAGYVALLAGAAGGQAHAARETVLKQVDLPHNYYWRELYIPQLTTGPSSVAFLPDGQSVVYSMGGSLWKQQVESERSHRAHASRTARYDYQPDVSQRWQERRVQPLRRQRGSSCGELDLTSGREQAAHQQWRRQSRAAPVARWLAARVGLDRRHRTFRT